MKDNSILNSTVLIPKALSFMVVRIEEVSEDTGEATFVYNPAVVYHTKVEKLESGDLKSIQNFAMMSDIYDECMHCALAEVIKASYDIFECDILDSLPIYDDDEHTLIETLSLNEVMAAAAEEEETIELTSTKDKYDLANLPVGVPLIN